MKIIALKSENVKRLHAVSITPDGKPVVIIGGHNSAGKSSVLDSIWYALGGKGALPPKPVREGADEAIITLDLGDYIVVRTIQPDGKSTLKLTSKDGAKYGSPQTILDAMVGNLSFDPLAFSRMDPKQQAETLKKLVGLDFSDIDRKRAACMEDRLLVGREVKQLRGQLAGLAAHEGVPVAEVSVAMLSQQLSAARHSNSLIATVKSEAQKAEASLDQWQKHAESLREQLAEAERETGKWVAIAAERRKAANAAVGEDEQAIVERMTNAEAVNRKVRENADRNRVAGILKKKEDEYAKWTLQLETLDGEKALALAAAKFPVPSLSFDESGVLVAGVPFQQASAAEQLRVSVAMGLAMNPKLKVLLVRDGSLLDEKSMGLLAGMAEDAGAQIWLEKVSVGEECAVVIEDGAVRGAVEVPA